jgi:hypothetical protein
LQQVSGGKRRVRATAQDRRWHGNEAGLLISQIISEAPSSKDCDCQEPLGCISCISLMGGQSECARGRRHRTARWVRKRGSSYQCCHHQRGATDCSSIDQQLHARSLCITSKCSPGVYAEDRAGTVVSMEMRCVLLIISKAPFQVLIKKFSCQEAFLLQRRVLGRSNLQPPPLFWKLTSQPTHRSRIT